MNKGIKFSSAFLCILTLTVGIHFSNAKAATISNQIINQVNTHAIQIDPSSGTISGPANQTTGVFSSPAISNQISSWLIKGTRFVILKCDTYGWYYGAWGSDYNGWHFGWVKASCIANNAPSNTGSISGTANQPTTEVFSSPRISNSPSSYLIQNTRFVILRCDTYGWYYGAWGNDYNGWHFGWVKSQYISNMIEY